MLGASPRRIAFVVSLGIALLSTIATIIIARMVGSTPSLLMLAANFAGILLLSYIILYFTIERFIYQKVKLIYKNIHNLKDQGNTVDVDMSTDVISGVSDEVMEWAEDRKLEIQKLKDQEEFRREFIGNLAHELKTPIFSIQGYILTLLEGGIEDEEVSVEFLRRAAKGVDRITHIIEDLDTITKFESGRLELNSKPFDILDLASEVMKDLEMKAQKKAVNLTFKEEYDGKMSVLGDRGRIGQVFTNLIANSINYSSEGGKTEIRFYDLDKQLLIEVADNGIGIDEKHLPRLFERFYRVDKSRARHEGGSGLGLSIVKHIIESHNQRINVRSTVGVGSTFSFTLQKA